jgi:hypothetical protein
MDIDHFFDRFTYQPKLPGRRSISEKTPTVTLFPVIPRWKLDIFKPRSLYRPKKLGSAKRAQVWETYAQLFIDKYQGTPWFDRVNPINRVYTVLKCWCCSVRELTSHGYGRFSGFEAGHVVAQSKTRDDTIANLRPICKDCNIKMGTMHMVTYAQYMEYTASEILQELSFC